MLGWCTRPGFAKDSYQEFSKRVLADKPESIKDDNFVNNLYDTIKSDTKQRDSFRVVHFSDPHLDPEYAEGSNWLCESYLCCRKENGFPT